jgi:hypothetical protein
LIFDRRHCKTDRVAAVFRSMHAGTHGMAIELLQIERVTHSEHRGKIHR